MSSINPVKHSFNTTLTTIQNNPKKTAIIAGSTGAVLAGAGAALLLTASVISGIAVAALGAVVLGFAAYQAIKAIKLNKQVRPLSTPAFASELSEAVSEAVKKKNVPLSTKAFASDLKDTATEISARIAKKASVKELNDKFAAKKELEDAQAKARSHATSEAVVDVQELPVQIYNWKDVAKVAAATIAVAGLGCAAYVYGPAAYASAQAAIPVVKAAANAAVAKTLAYANSYAVPVMIRA